MRKHKLEKGRNSQIAENKYYYLLDYRITQIETEDYRKDYRITQNETEVAKRLPKWNRGLPDYFLGNPDYPNNSYARYREPRLEMYEP